MSLSRSSSVCAVSGFRALRAAAPSSAALWAQRRSYFRSSQEKRDQETFLAAHNPFQVLGMEETSDVKKITDTYKKMTAFYSPQGPRPNKTKFDLVSKAYEVLTDPDSPYFKKARSNDVERSKLALELMTPGKRFAVKLQAWSALSLFGLFFGVVMYVLMLPAKKAIRSVTRSK